MKKLFFLLALAPFFLDATPEDAAKLVSVRAINPNIRVECWYATQNNFTGQQVYPTELFGECFVLEKVAKKLDKIQKTLQKDGRGLLIWDGFRSQQAQETLWNICPDERYVSDPSKGGRHTRGTTVDLTIIDLKTNTPLNMGTGFDVFTQRAWSHAENLSPEIQANRALLQNLMKEHGFTEVETEWWHFDYKNYNEYKPLDVTYKEILAKLPVQSQPEIGA